MFGKAPETLPAFTFSTASSASNPGLPPTNPNGTSFVFGGGTPVPKTEPLVFTSHPINSSSESFITRIQQLEDNMKRLDANVKDLEKRTSAESQYMKEPEKHTKEELLKLFQNYMIAAFKLVNCLFSMSIAKIARLRDCEIKVSHKSE